MRIQKNGQPIPTDDTISDIEINQLRPGTVFKYARAHHADNVYIKIHPNGAFHLNSARVFPIDNQNSRVLVLVDANMDIGTKECSSLKELKHLEGTEETRYLLDKTERERARTPYQHDDDDYEDWDTDFGLYHP